MPKLPRLSAREMAAALRRGDFVRDRQKGSHLTMRHPTSGRRVVIPMHPGDMAVGLVHDILKQAGLTLEEFVALLR